MGKMKQLTMENYKDDVSAKFDFWRFLRINEESFLLQAEVGDLLLCDNGKGLVTQSKNIDRLCMLVKLMSDQSNTAHPELYVLRVGSNIQNPIVLQPWTEFRIQRTKNYKDCFFRHLYCERSDDFLMKSQFFIQKLRDNPLVKVKGDPGKRLYRNAELIGKFYKYVGLLPEQENSQFSPKDFS